MKSKVLLSLMLLGLLGILAACGTDPDAHNLYKKESPLQVEFLSPGEYKEHQKEKIHFEIMQNEKQAKELQFVHVSVWDRTRAFNLEMIEATREADGSYSLEVDFPNDGLYYVQVHTANDNEVIAPTRRTLIGKLSEEDSQALQSNTPAAGGSTGHHH